MTAKEKEFRDLEGTAELEVRRSLAVLERIYVELMNLRRISEFPQQVTSPDQFESIDRLIAMVDDQIRLHDQRADLMDLKVRYGLDIIIL